MKFKKIPLCMVDIFFYFIVKYVQQKKENKLYAENYL